MHDHIERGALRMGVNLPRIPHYVNRLNDMEFARGSIDADAERVVRKLARSGYKAYLVGGCVRDLLLGRAPKDFDVATSATPNEIKELFRNCRIIGRRFRLAHIFFGSKIIETSTFRATPRSDVNGHGDSLLIRRDNVFGSDTEDARRRDFTINGLFYDVETEQVIDFVGGMQDLRARVVRTIGDPDIRFQEDPVRILRAIKFAARLNFTIEPVTYAALLRHRDEIRKCAPPRVLEELYRLLRGGAAKRSMELLTETGVDVVLAPQLAAMFRNDGAVAANGTSQALGAPVDEEEAAWHAAWADELPTTEAPVLELTFASRAEIAERRAIAWKMLRALDTMVTRGEEFTNAMLLASLLQPFLYPSLTSLSARPTDAHVMIMELAIPLAERLHVARRDAERLRQVLLAQRRMTPTRGRRGRPAALVRRDYFAEALAVYELTMQCIGEPTQDVDYWHKVQTADRDVAGNADRDDAQQKRRRRRRGGRRRGRDEDETEDSDMSAVASG